MTTFYVLVVLITVNGKQYLSPPMPFTTNRDCQTAVFVLKKMVKYPFEAKCLPKKAA